MYLCFTAVLGAAWTFPEHFVVAFLVHGAVAHWTIQANKQTNAK